MALMDPDTKALMIEKGVWPDFVNSRNEIRAAGAKPSEAHRQALAMYLTFDEMPEMGRLATEQMKKLLEAKDSSPAEKKPHFDGKLRKPKKVVEIEYADIEDFGDRRCSEQEIIRWVGQNMFVDGIKPCDCPDPTAWNMFQQCRNSTVFAMDFWKTIYTKIIPSKKELGEDSGVDKDKVEEMLVEMMEKIMVISEKIKADSQ